MKDQRSFIAQATENADKLLHDAVECIDNAFGDGYAREHPELIADFMRTASTDQMVAHLHKISGMLEKRIGID